ncbi:MAG: PAS domain S-box protein [Deltaproteobacteria bacterium]
MNRSGFKDMNIRKKLFIIFGVLLLFFGALVTATLMYMVKMKTLAVSTNLDILNKADSLFDLKSDMEGTRKDMLFMALESDWSKLGRGLENIKGAMLHVDGDIDSILGSGAVNEDIKVKIGRLKSIWESFKETREKEIIPAIQKGRRGLAIGVMTGVQEERFRRMSSIIDGVIADEREEIRGANSTLERMLANVMLLYVLIAAAGLSLGVVLILYFSRHIGRRFSGIMGAVERFKEGEFRTKIEDAGGDELGALAECLNGMFRRLYEDKLTYEQYFNILEWEAKEKEKKDLELLRSEERFRGLVETTSDWVWEVDENGAYTYVSPKVSEILGYRAEDLLGKTPFDLMPDEEADRVREIFKGIAELKRPFSALENINLHKDGRMVVLETGGTPFFDGGGNLLGYRGIDRDVTQRKRAEEEGKRMYAQVVHSEKMASVGQLAAGVAHEINNPVGFVSSNLNTLSGYIGDFTVLFRMYFSMASDLEAGRTGDALAHWRKITEYQKNINIVFVIEDVALLTEEAKDGMARIKNIVSGLKEFSHAGSGKMETCDIHQCLENAVRLSWHEIKYKAGVETDFEQIPLVECMPQQLTQVFLNIIINAVQAMPEKGTVSIKTYSKDGYAVVEIRDDGAGMTEDVMKRIFDPFFTTKEVGKGTGLGLSIAYGIIKEHKGAIEVRSKAAEGTTFTIRLPAASGAAATA